MYYDDANVLLDAWS